MVVNTVTPFSFTRNVVVATAPALFKIVARILSLSKSPTPTSAGTKSEKSDASVEPLTVVLKELLVITEPPTPAGP